MLRRPQPDEYAPYYDSYISRVGDGDLIGILEQGKNSTFDLFYYLSEVKFYDAYAEGKWTLREVIGHMIDTERVFAFRAFCFSRDFMELPSFDQEIFVTRSTFNFRSLRDLAAEFKALRESNLYFIKTLTEDQLSRKGMAGGNAVTVRALLYILAGHELHHMNIVKERYL